VRINSTRVMRRSFPTSTHDAVRPARVCNALDGLAQCGVDDLSAAVRDEAGSGYQAPNRRQDQRGLSGFTAATVCSARTPSDPELLDPQCFLGLVPRGAPDVIPGALRQFSVR
jgi:hypothetical protein